MPPAPGVRPDLATRLRQSQRALKGRLGKPETVLTLMRAAHETLDPEKIGELVVEQASGWLKAAACVVLSTDLDGQVVPLAGRGLTAPLETAATAVASWVLANGQDFATGDLRRDG